ncbi:uncharacterized protein LOC113502295 [Trichoplusia ni]|uniref:Uncharacterized protein LOC113502295 n=1 Tax=Trichoplusia ni TaxID=7111 RepID=A0A7E5WFY6_TRINI|nr:uncharacterized protein LOC113502295 [Trichoplusia ni]
MNSIQLFVIGFTTLVLIYVSNNEVSAAPDPCFWKDYKHKDIETTTGKPTEAPELIEEFNRLKEKKISQFEQLIRNWLLWRPGGRSRDSQIKNPADKLIMNYVRFLSKLLDSFNVSNLLNFSL